MSVFYLQWNQNLACFFAFFSLLFLARLLLFQCVVKLLAAKSCFHVKQRYVINFNAYDLINLRRDRYRLNVINVSVPSVFRMITDVQLAIFSNLLGVSVFLLVVLYHYIAANNPKSHTS